MVFERLSPMSFCLRGRKVTGAMPKSAQNNKVRDVMRVCHTIVTVTVAGDGPHLARELDSASWCGIGMVHAPYLRDFLTLSAAGTCRTPLKLTKKLATPEKWS